MKKEDAKIIVQAYKDVRETVTAKFRSPEEAEEYEQTDKFWESVVGRYANLRYIRAKHIKL